MPGRARHGAPWPATLDTTSSDSADDSNDFKEEIDHQRYLSLALSTGMQHSQARLRAMQELQAVLQTCYATRASKVTQAAMYTDLTAAVGACDSRAALKAQLSDLLRTAEKVLPKQKRHAIIAENKQAMVLLARRKTQQKQQAGQRTNQHVHNQTGQGNADDDSDCGSDDDADDDSDEVIVPMTDLPVPDAITQTIMSRLDPYTLACASKVCRSWHQLVSSSDLWRYWCIHLYGPDTVKDLLPSTANTCRAGMTPVDGIATCSHAALFTTLVAGDPRWVMLYKPAVRMYKAGRMVWTHLDSLDITTTSPPATQYSDMRDHVCCHKAQSPGRQHSPPIYHPVTCGQVVQWLLHAWPPESSYKHMRDHRFKRRNGSYSTSSSSGGDDGGPGSGTVNNKGAGHLRLWNINLRA